MKYCEIVVEGVESRRTFQEKQIGQEMQNSEQNYLFLAYFHNCDIYFDISEFI